MRPIGLLKSVKDRMGKESETAWIAGDRPMTSESPLRRAVAGFFRDRVAVLGLVVVLLLTLISILAPLIAPYDKVIEISSSSVLQPPSTAHPFGTDNLGRDILVRMIWGGRLSLPAGYVAVFIGMVGGILLGLVSGFFGGRVDNVIQRIVEVFLAIPGILLALSIIGTLGPGLLQVMLAIGLARIPGYTRQVRGCVLEAREYEYVTAARSLGAGSGRIMLRHVLPNVIGPIVVFSTLGLGSAIITAAGLSYLGLGAQPPSPEWGAMLSLGRQFMRRAWWPSFFPGIVIVITVLSINLVGDGIQDAMNPKLRK